MERKRNRVTLEALYKQYANLVLKICYDYCQDYETARNITQEVFLVLYTEMDKIDVDKAVKWLKVTARNKTINYMKKHRFEVLTDEVIEVADRYDYYESAEETILSVMESEERSIREKHMLEELHRKNERWYMAITMIYYLEYPQAKAAEILGINMNALYVLTNRAKKWIEEYYRKLDEDIL